MRVQYLRKAWIWLYGQAILHAEQTRDALALSLTFGSWRASAHRSSIHAGLLARATAKHAQHTQRAVLRCWAVQSATQKRQAILLQVSSVSSKA